MSQQVDPVEHEAKSKQDQVPSGQSGKEEVVSKKVESAKKAAPAIPGKGSGLSETTKDKMPSESALAKEADSSGLDKEEQPSKSTVVSATTTGSTQSKSTGASATTGSTTAKAIGQQPPGGANQRYPYENFQSPVYRGGF